MDLTWSTFGTDLPDFNIREGDQLFYVPVENIMAGLQVDWHNLSGYYHHRWFGPSPGINVDVEAGNVAYAGISYEHFFSRVKTAVYFQADNVLNVPYRVIERRPMPGQSFQAGIKLSLHGG